MRNTIYRYRNGKIEVRCPVCKEFQPLPEGDEDYEVGPRNVVWPDFVCMNQPGGRYCTFSDTIRLETMVG